MPADISLNIALDQTKFIKRSISEVEETLLISLVLVILIIFLFFPRLVNCHTSAD
jgi:multidrug efflux pump